ncbi:stage II sporulation protein P [Cytobacillus sp. IB215316]|uniref:stage II sporulation protein P n=1 Tax=Cytobacillus sp. IB215316 TaxID=3097354 RepID=UPI002A166789|nr:stage II sporulation protein P [Cytobacillus sp. IB215316]MDX8360216.1 stage II sporulation protein P [Cytobacillus sp. IB215316]
MKPYRNKRLLLVTSIPMLIFFIFFISTLIVSLNVKYESSFIDTALGNVESEDLLIHFLKAENQHFTLEESENDLFSFKNIAESILQFGTNIILSDTTTFFGGELPGITSSLNKTSITEETEYVFESSPPIEVLLKEREVATEKLKQDENIMLVENNLVDQIPNKTVYIYQTHSWESFLPYIKDASSPNHAISNDNRVNVVALGKRLSANLLKEGIGAHHDQTNMTAKLHEKEWKTTMSYNLSREILEVNTNNNSHVEYYIDIHRDSARRDVTTKMINGIEYATLYFVLGTENINYEQNKQFVEKLNAELNKRYPGISRGIYQKSKKDGNGIYNQDISSKAITLEIGGVDNTFEELERSVDAFSEIFSDLYWADREAIEVNG